MTYYNIISKSYDELYEEEQLKKCEIVAKNINLENKKILDVGCGTGIATSFFKCEVGIDPAEKMIEIAKKKYRKIKFILGKAEKLPFRDNEFDVVISLTTIQNFEDIDKGLKEIKRVAREFVLSFLKVSGKKNLIEEAIKKNFKVKKVVEEEKDIIFFCGK
ncbi:MAG: class I SAM-dependent methyltransferase [Candidatus Woesearchaeota archaeon]